MFKVQPAKNMLYAAALLVVVGLLVAIWPSLTVIWQGLMLVFTLAVIYDWLSSVRIKSPIVERSLANAMAVGLWHKVKLTLHNPNPGELHCKVFDHFPASCNYRKLPQRLSLQTDQQAEIKYDCQPLQRGKIMFPLCQCLIDSKLGFWRFNRQISVPSEVRVYPNYAPVIEYALLATENHLSLMGILKNRRRGQGMDFHQLREFREGDSMRQIDWKATSRTQKIIAREYQDERDQEIIILMDCGHRMLAQDGSLSHFDHSLNSLLLLSYVALRQGDAVGVSTFSHDEPRWIRPIKGVANINLLLNNIYDLQPSNQAPDYSAGARKLLLNHRKRSLVILLTNLRDDDAEDLQAAVSILKKRHRVVLASLQEQAIHQVLDQNIHNLDDALTVAATHEYMQKRNQLVNLLRKQGIKTLDVLPEELPLALTNCYLDLKVSGQN